MSERITAIKWIEQQPHKRFKSVMSIAQMLLEAQKIEEENIKRAFWDGSQCGHDYIGIEDIYFNDKYSEKNEVNKSKNINDNLPF
jgi:hypothetical protein